MYIFLVSVFAQLSSLISNLDPAYFDILKIFAGCIGWIGGLTLFVWWKEKKKKCMPLPLIIDSHN